MKATETAAVLSSALQDYAERKFRERAEIYAPIFSEIESGLSCCTQEEAVLMRFLYGTMPVRDAGEYGVTMWSGADGCPRIFLSITCFITALIPRISATADRFFMSG